MKPIKICKICINIFWFAVIAFLSWRMPFYTDDFLHKTSFATGEEINSIGMILPSVLTYYNVWGGRAVSMFLIQMILMLPRWVYAVSNGIVYITMVNILYGYAKPRTRDTDDAMPVYDAIIYSLLFVFVWFFMPDFYDVCTWTTGTITYLWTNVFIFGLGLLYFRDYRGDHREDTSGGQILNLTSVFGYLILGFLAGLSNESGACTILFALLLYTVASLIAHRHISISKWCGLAGCLIGTALLMLAPGNMVRAAQAGNEAEAGASMMTILLHRIGREGFYSLMFLGIPIAVCVALYLITLRNRLTLSELVRDIRTADAPFFMILACISILALTFASGFANRVFQFPFLMLSVSFVISLNSLKLPASVGIYRQTIYRGISVFIVLMMLMVITEITAGTLMAGQSGSFFDRQMMYYHVEDQSVDGLLPGNGIVE